MRNKTIRHLSLVLALMLFAGVLAACNNGSGDRRKEAGREEHPGTKARKSRFNFTCLGMLQKICLLLNPRSISWLRQI
ncbi:hypothetical protein MT997_12875 [Paenibacillus sp. OVF10]|nr:hypothetical protein MT997_12875 [Paenibacillus sp. OVF10]